MLDPTAFTVTQLKDILKSHELSAVGSKSELIARLMEKDPSGDWMRTTQEGNASDHRTDKSRRREDSMRQRELEVCRREKKMVERELQLAQREIALLRERENMRSISPERSRSQEKMIAGNGGGATHSRPSMTAIADLLADFDGGTSGDFDTWERQVRLLRATYCLADNQTKLTIGMRLKGKALEWFHSRPEFISMSFDALVDEIKTMFHYRQSKVEIRKKLEARVWKKNETFREYVHEKVIMGNRVPIETDEIIDYIIDGIPDNVLRNQARIQRFAKTESLLEAFESITLRDYQANLGRPDRCKQTTCERESVADENVRRNNSGDEGGKIAPIFKRCFNCGARDHISANCPSRALGAKCFNCGEFGHVALKCPKKGTASGTSCAVTFSSRRKYIKDVQVDGTKIEALIDTGSDISLMRADEYVKMGSPRFQATEVCFAGVGSNGMAALGEFHAELTVDGHSYPIIIRVVSDTVSRQRLIIGTDFLDTVEVNVKGGIVTISPVDKQANDLGDLPSVFQLDVENMYEANKVDVTHIPNAERRHAVATLVENYKPSQTRETDVRMTIILKDDEPVYQRARRLSPSERDMVNNQIEEMTGSKNIKDPVQKSSPNSES